MSVKIYHNPRCSKSRETLALLEGHNISPEIIKYLDTPPTATELQDILTLLSLKPRDLMRKKEKEYKEQNLADESLGDEDLIDAMIKYPRLIERPIVIKDGKAAIGRPPHLILEIL